MEESTRSEDQGRTVWQLAFAHQPVLARLSHGHWHQVSLAKWLRMDKSQLSRTVKELTRVGLVELKPCRRRDHTRDRVILTSKGGRMLALLERTASGTPPAPRLVPEAVAEAVEQIVEELSASRIWSRRSEDALRLADCLEDLSGANFFALPSLRKKLVPLAEKWFPLWRPASDSSSEPRVRCCRTVGRILLWCVRDSIPSYREMWVRALSPLARNLIGRTLLDPEASDWSLAVLRATLDASGRYPEGEASALLRLTSRIPKWRHGGPALARFRDCLGAIEDEEQRVLFRSRLAEIRATGGSDAKAAIEDFLAPVSNKWHLDD